MRVDPGPLQQYAAGYRIAATFVDALLLSLWMGILTLIRCLVKKKKKPNLHPSALWYVPKVIGMGFMIVNFVYFVFQGAFVDKVSGKDTFGFVILTTLIGGGLLYWGYRVIWKSVISKAG